MLILTLPMPPTINSYYGHSCVGGKRIITFIRKEGKSYREQVRQIVAENNWNFQANVPIKVSIVLCFGRKGTNDLDNRMKGLLDACTHANVWDDDGLIDELHISRGSVRKGGQVLLQVQAMDDVEDY